MRRTSTSRRRSPRRRSAPEKSPAARRRGRVWFLTGGGVLLAVAAVWGAKLGWVRLAAHPSLAVKTVEVVAGPHVAEKEILRLARLAPGESWLDVPVREVRFRVRSHPWVEDVKVRRPWPGRVRLIVRECVPIARVSIAGREYALAADLRVLPGPAASEEPLPLVEAGEKKRPLDEECLSRALAYVQALREIGISGEEPVEVVTSPSRPDRIRLPSRGFSARIEVGVPTGRAARNVRAFLESVDEVGGSRGTLRVISEGTAVWEASA